MSAVADPMVEDTRAVLTEILGFDPETAPPVVSAHLCGACTRGDHADCSGWCRCPLGCRDAPAYTSERLRRFGWLRALRRRTAGWWEVPGAGAIGAEVTALFDAAPMLP